MQEGYVLLETINNLGLEVRWYQSNISPEETSWGGSAASPPLPGLETCRSFSGLIPCARWACQIVNSGLRGAGREGEGGEARRRRRRTSLTRGRGCTSRLWSLEGGVAARTAGFPGRADGAGGMVFGSPVTCFTPLSLQSLRLFSPQVTGRTFSV